MMAISSPLRRLTPISGEYVSMRWVSWSRIGNGRASWAARRTSRASASWARRSAWMAADRCVDEPRMSAIA